MAKLERHRCRGSISIHFFLFLFFKKQFLVALLSKYILLILLISHHIFCYGRTSMYLLSVWEFTANHLSLLLANIYPSNYVDEELT